MRIIEPKMFTNELSIAWPFFVSSIVAFEVAIYVWTKKKSPEASYFMLTMLMAAMWSLSSGLLLLAESFEVKVFWVDFKFVFVASLPVFWFLMASAFFHGKSVVPRRKIVFLFIVPVIAVAMIATNAVHHLFFEDAVAVVENRFVAISRVYGPAFWIFTVYEYALILGGIVFFVRRMLCSRGHLKIQALIMTAGSIVPLALNAAYLSNPEGFLHLDFTPVAFAASGVIYFIGLFRYRMFDLKPIAHEEVIRSMEDAVIVLDNDGFIVDSNAAATQLNSDFIKKSEIGLQILTGFPFLEKSWNRARELDRFQSEFEIQVGSDLRWYAANFKVIFNSKNIAQGRLVVLRDVSEQKRTELQLLEAKQKAEELSRLKSAFLSNMSHDIRTPLAGIIGLADVLIEECTGEKKEFATMIRDSGDRLLKLLNSLLSISHLSSGTLDQNSELINLNDISERILVPFEKEIASKGVELRISLPTEIAEAFCDPAHLVHALTHILDHSVRFTESGSIQFDLRREQNDLIFRITDTGRGFEPEFVRSISESLDSISLAEFGLDKGSGLGLRVAHGLIEEMGGELQIRSELGIGSTFTLRLPARIEADRPATNPKRSRVDSFADARARL